MRTVAIIGSAHMRDSDVSAAFESLIESDARCWFTEAEWRAYDTVVALVNAHLSLREERASAFRALPALVEGATELWVIWDGATEECRNAIWRASRAGITVRVVVCPVGSRRTKRKPAEVESC